MNQQNLMWLSPVPAGPYSGFGTTFARNKAVGIHNNKCAGETRHKTTSSSKKAYANETTDQTSRDDAGSASGGV